MQIDCRPVGLKRVRVYVCVCGFRRGIFFQPELNNKIPVERKGPPPSTLD